MNGAFCEYTKNLGRRPGMTYKANQFEPGDVVFGISTSGNSKNVENGLKISHEKGATTIGLLGNNGGIIKDIFDIQIIVNSFSTPRIQEAHRTIYHIICELVEKSLVK